LQSQQKQPDFSNYLRVLDKYILERQPDGYGINSEKFIYHDLINPTPLASQIIESLANDLYKKVAIKKNIEVNFDEELADRMGKISINKALSKDAETSTLVLVPISKKEKQSLKSQLQDEQSHLEKIIKKIIEKKLNEKFGTITTPFSARS
ncbi:42562_t:CDS:2, partial [Gigaspora margarita]